MPFTSPHHHHHQSPFMDDPPCPSSLFSITNPHYSPPPYWQHHQNQPQEPPHPLIPTLNFKLDLNDNNDNNSNASHHVTIPSFDQWQTHRHSYSPPTLNEPFWKPLNGSNEEIGDERQKMSLEEKYRLFGELEAIYSITKTAADRAGSGSGSALTGETSPSASNLPQFGNNNDDNNINNNNLGPTAATETTATKIVLKRKRKKKMKEQLGFVVGFFESLAKQVMEHQEGLHKKFLEAIERMDRGRTEREEAWRRQEAEKRNREAADRANDLALASNREALFVSYIEKITGQSIDLSAKPTNSIADASNRWPKPEVEALIRARSGLESQFQDPGLKGPLWEQISSQMASMGYQRSAKRCKQKWENINKYFKKKKDCNNVSPKSSQKSSKGCSYFDQLDQLYSGTNRRLTNFDHSSFSGIDELIVRSGNTCEIESLKSNFDAHMDNEKKGGNEEEEADPCNNDLGD